MGVSFFFWGLFRNTTGLRQDRQYIIDIYRIKIDLYEFFISVLSCEVATPFLAVLFSQIRDDPDSEPRGFHTFR